MKSNRALLIRLALVISLPITGCASFEPGLRFQNLHGPRQPTVTAAQENLEVSAEEFITRDKSKMMFDTNLASNHVLAILLRADNAGSEKYSLRRDDIRASLSGQSLSRLAPKEAANLASTSEYIGKALAWTVATGPFAILLWPVTIGASATHTHGVNKRIEQFFEGTSYQDAIVAPKQAAVGFVYFKLPDGIKTVENLVLEADASGDPSGKKLTYKLSLPPIEITE